MLYLDASALIKGYLSEAASADVVAAIAGASAVATSAIAYPELRAAFARALRERRLDTAAHAAVVALLDARWSRYAVVVVDEVRLREAGRLADAHTQHALRALDAIHLASALRLATGRPASITFACWDLRLWRAARDEGFTMLPATEPA
jgi:uncharacterized protein